MLTKGFVVLATLAAAVQADTWGSAWSLGPTRNGASIVKASVSFNPGAPPSPNRDILALWVGISNGTSGLIQAGCDSVSNMSGYCGATAKQWCCGASYFGYINGTLSQWSGKFVPTEGTDTINIAYALQSDNRTWRQTVTKNGATISTLDSYDGPLLQGGFGTGTECNDQCPGSVSTQTYTNAQIVLDKADASFSGTLGVGSGVVASQLTTSDGGKTWTVASIKIPPMKIDSKGNPNTATPAYGSTSSPSSSSSSGSSSSSTGTGGTVPKYGQCGGIGYTGPTQCVSGTTCTKQNDYYSQCL